MTEFKATRLVKVETVGSSQKHSMCLKEEFKWFLSDEFKKLREGFIPTDYREFMDNDNDNEKSLKEKTPPPSQPAYERLEIFWQKFNQLANTNRPFAMQSDKGTVGRYELQEALVSCGKFHQNDALVLIDEMLSIRKIIIVAVDTYRKNTGDNDTVANGRTNGEAG